MLFGQLELALGAEHAVRGDTADRSSGELGAARRDGGADGREHGLEPGPRIGRAANDLERLAADIHFADAQLVGIGMRLRREHMTNAEARELLRRILYALDFEAEIGEAFADFRERSLGLQMILEPGERELHRDPPPAEGTSSGRKP